MFYGCPRSIPFGSPAAHLKGSRRPYLVPTRRQGSVLIVALVRLPGIIVAIGLMRSCVTPKSGPWRLITDRRNSHRSNRLVSGVDWRTSENAVHAKFAEIPIPRTPVNRGQESKEGPVTQRKQVCCPTTAAYQSLILVILPAGPLQNVRDSSVSPVRSGLVRGRGVLPNPSHEPALSWS